MTTQPVARIEGVTFAEVPFHLSILTEGAPVQLSGTYVWNGNGYTVDGESTFTHDPRPLTVGADVHHDEAVLRWCAAALGIDWGAS